MTDVVEEGASPEADPEEPAETAPEIVRKHGAVYATSCGDEVLHCTTENILDVCASLRDDGYLAFIDVFAVDYLTYAPSRELPNGVDEKRFEVVTLLLNRATGERVRLRTHVDIDEEIPSLTGLFMGADASEREIFDMFGIQFTNHPDMTRILMPESWDGHPLRKDFSVGRVPVQFKGTPENS